ncbi:flavin reductase family protein [Enemella evansiae]|uniref:flavin reductase family protein n=1 Tax=Enemella evansiae TaxID=2016499 RepID=UPI00105F2C1C|nr:flavin reductase family protein [Enemella evansiae]TDO86261.1 flavin reductase (DIM6/NTAB) family NADH-FMN oxidoreductase RutF [Enemella evansiae]
MSEPAEPRDDLVAGVPAAEHLRRGMATFATGVTVITAYAGEIQYAMTANSFTSLSLDPPLVMVSVARGGRFHRPVLDAGAWAVSVLGADQLELARHFSDAHRDRLRQFETVPHRISTITGSPLLLGSLAWFECVTDRVVEAGDHSLLIGAVHSCWVTERPGRPLTYFRGVFLPGPG